MPLPFFTAKPKSLNIPVICVSSDLYASWLEGQENIVQKRLSLSGFKGKAGSAQLIHDEAGKLDFVLAGVSSPVQLYDTSSIVSFVQAQLPEDTLKDCSFTIVGVDNADLEKAYLGWAMGAYHFGDYKAEPKALPCVVLPKDVDKKRVNAFAEAIFKLRDLVNMPANDLGPAELLAAAEALLSPHKATFKITEGKKLEKGFPLVHAVGMAAIKERAPRLIDIKWGKKSDPKLTLVGKGVCFDTGGLDLKPSPYMRFMKKDMGGAAHALALAHIIMSLKLPVQLQVIIPAVENAVAGASFRPGDVFKSRSGITVENVDTDAEGRLILADALAYAAEGQPDLVIDFATLTGSARAALGQDIPAAFTNDTDLECKLRSITAAAEDPVWPMPLHSDYESLLKSDVADTTNHVGMPGDLIYSAIFLRKFLGENAPKWIHVDCFAWETAGRPGRAKGGKDTGLRGIFAVLEQLYKA